MGSTKIKRILLSLGLIASININALSFEEYQKQQQAGYKTYKDTIESEFKAYKAAYDKEFKQYKIDLKNRWDNPEVSTSHKWVQYDKKLTTKKVVDFKKQEIHIEVIAKDEKEAKEKLKETFAKLLKDDTKTAYNNDILSNKIYKTLKKPKPKIKVTQPIVKDIVTKKDTKKIIKTIETKPLKKVVYKNKFIYKVTIKMPANSLLRKAKYYKANVHKYAKKEKLNPNLIFAIMHSESSFNPMAESHIPAYGLMQIVPRSAGIDAYRYLYKKKKLVPSSFLFNYENNIQMGSAYLHILYFRYLKKIKNPKSRLFCTIAAYNTGAGNVAKAFTGKTNINSASRIINKMTPEEVHQKLLKDLPHAETKNYLKKVYDRTFMYDILLEKELSK